MEQLLHQILEEIRTIKSDIQQLNQNQLLLNQNQQLLDQNQKQMSLQIDNLLQSVQRIEDRQPEEISALLKRIHDNLLDKDSEIAALNKRVFRLESDFEKFSKQ